MLGFDGITFIDIYFYRIETCLCQDNAACKTCRLIKRVKSAEFAKYDAERERDTAKAELAELEQVMVTYQDNGVFARHQGRQREERDQAREVEEDEEEDGEDKERKCEDSQGEEEG